MIEEYLERLKKAKKSLKEILELYEEIGESIEVYRLRGKIEGIDLAIGYLLEMTVESR